MGAHERCSTRVCSGLSRKYSTWQRKTIFVGDEEKKFDDVDDRTVDDDNEETVYTVTDEAPILYKRLSVVNAVPPNKLECLSLQSKYIYINESANS